MIVVCNDFLIFGIWVLGLSVTLPRPHAAHVHLYVPNEGKFLAPRLEKRSNPPRRHDRFFVNTTLQTIAPHTNKSLT